MFKNILKSYTFWFTFITLSVIYINNKGKDDYNILLFLISQPNILMHSIKYFYPKLEFAAHYSLIKEIYYINLVYWISIGVIFDLVKYKKRKNV
ncbi:MAG: hypothetical protein K0S34_1029 [Bacillales bacterium]|jgi:hypothetical protein|nr:hypothetical protein [Bacillales bacterium]